MWQSYLLKPNHVHSVEAVHHAQASPMATFVFLPHRIIKSGQTGTFAITTLEI